MNKGLDEFQIEEYKNISNAHFETNKQIGIFFRYFLLIASAPALIFVWFGNKNGFLDEFLNGDDTIKNVFVGSFLIFIAIIGMLSSFYLISLRLDSILYARTINGIRKYFFLNKIDYEDQYRVLPKQTNQPKYNDFHTFGILVYAVALINSIYFALGTRIIASVGDDFFVNYLGIKVIIKDYNIWYIFLSFLVLFFSHVWYYNFISNYRKIQYMKSRIIGIDIDGVLNRHREMFCLLHMKNMKNQFGDIEKIPDKKKLEPEEIIKIPVSQIKEKNISNDDEFDVFNDPEYWGKQLLISSDVGKVIKELKNTFGYKINIHSYRPWPQYTYGSSKRELVDRAWEGKSLAKITKEWLKKAEIPYNNIYIEKSSIDTSKRSFSIFGLLFGISKSQFKNRFYYTNKKPYRYFVEDTPENAIKLCSNCEFVFLIDQPYNTKDNFPQELPGNVIRVMNWGEIKNKIKELG